VQIDFFYRSLGCRSRCSLDTTAVSSTWSTAVAVVQPPCWAACAPSRCTRLRRFSLSMMPLVYNARSMGECLSDAMSARLIRCSGSYLSTFFVFVDQKCNLKQLHRAEHEQTPAASLRSFSLGSVLSLAVFFCFFFGYRRAPAVAWLTSTRKWRSGDMVLDRGTVYGELPLREQVLIE
jgi:hypothetical protein